MRASKIARSESLRERLALGYVIEICATCGRQAVHPYCAHRSESERWTVTVAVEVKRPLTALRDAARVSANG